MNKIISKPFFLILSVLALQFGLSAAYGYVEPTREILPQNTTYGISNPDLPKRNGAKVGDVLFHSAISTSVIFDPNIYLSPQDEKYDIINLLEASFGLEIPFQEHKLSLEYLGQQYFFERYDINNHFDQQVRGLLELNFTDYKVTLRETYRKYETLPGLDTSGRITQDDNSMRLGVAHETDKFAFDVGYSNIVHHYFSDNPVFGPVTFSDRDSMLHVADVSVGYKIMPKTSIVLEDDYGFASYRSDNSPDYYFNDILVGVKGELHENLTTTLQAGWRYQYFDKSPFLYDGTVSKFICRGGIKYAFSGKDIFDLGVQRTVNDSTYADNTYYTTDFVSLGYTHAFTEKLSSRIFGTYQRNMYPTETTEGTKTAKRVDNSCGAGVNLHYDIRRWLSAEIGYEFKEAVGNFETFSYNDNIATIKVTAGF
jgi:Putative beta-barrel porin 2